jgi:hypothetical protein
MITLRAGLYGRIYSTAIKSNIQFKWPYVTIRRPPFFHGKENKMSWDDAFNQLEQELGREPYVDEVQNKMLKIVESRINEQWN